MLSALRGSLSKGKRVVFFHGLLSSLIITSDLHVASSNSKPTGLCRGVEALQATSFKVKPAALKSFPEL